VLNRPKKLNSLDRNMLDLLRPKIEVQPLLVQLDITKFLMHPSGMESVGTV
jgi:hypothetical protein